MGVAILSGVLTSLDAKPPASFVPPPKWESHTPGTVTPQTLEDESFPSRFIACVSREETARKLATAFFSAQNLGRSVEIVQARNMDAVRQSNVILLW